MFRLLLPLVLFGNLFGDSIIYNDYPIKLFWKPKPEPIIKKINNVHYIGIYDNYLIYTKNNSIVGNRIYHIPCKDVINAKFENGLSIQYNCNKNTIMDLNFKKQINSIDTSFSRDSRFGFSIGMINDRAINGVLGIGISYDLKQTRKDELFIAGTSFPLVIHSFSWGWKHYSNPNKSSSGYSIIGIQHIHFGGIMSFYFHALHELTEIYPSPEKIYTVPVLSFGYEYETAKGSLIQISFIPPTLKIEFPN